MDVFLSPSPNHPMSPNRNTLSIDTKPHSSISPRTSFPLSASPTRTSFRSSPLNPHASTETSTCNPPSSAHQIRRSFPASRPLRPFPSIAASLANTKLASSSSEVSEGEQDKEPASTCTAPPSTTASSLSSLTTTTTTTMSQTSPVINSGEKTVVASSKWTGGFIVLGMSQAEFSRQD